MVRFGVLHHGWSHVRDYVLVDFEWQNVLLCKGGFRTPEHKAFMGDPQKLCICKRGRHPRRRLQGYGVGIYIRIVMLQIHLWTLLVERGRQFQASSLCFHLENDPHSGPHRKLYVA